MSRKERERKKRAREKLAKAREVGEEKLRRFERRSGYGSKTNKAGTSNQKISEFAPPSTVDDGEEIEPVEDHSPAWNPSEERRQRIHDKLDKAAQSKQAKRLQEARASVDPEGYYLPSKSVPLTEIFGISEEQSKIAAAYVRLMNKSQAPVNRKAFDDFIARCKLHFAIEIDMLVKRLGVQPFRMEMSEKKLLQFHTACEDIFCPRLHLPKVELQKVNDDHFQMLWQPSEKFVVHEAFMADPMVRSIPLNFSSWGRLAMLYGYTLALRVILFGIETFLVGEDVALGKAGRIPMELILLWQENISEIYIGSHEYPMLFERQPIRIFAGEIAGFMKQRGWGSS